MTARMRKFIGVFAILGFLVLYIGLVGMVADYIPKHWAAQLAYFVVAGMGWGVPILPLLSWMNRGR
ncbi:DUF2842 domain-containing protein [Phenylobacterium immobile]|uniref:DUF2842 domain-containing protein n=1 Tax=Phenylobacterium immobile TaxID=21 RepID=UPI000A973199|nr:DUF2842 domain-containing protein [Phenylobacterium immobile]